MFFVRKRKLYVGVILFWESFLTWYVKNFNYVHNSGYFLHKKPNFIILK